MAYEVAQAYVQILPTTEKFGSTLKSDLGDSTTEAGKESGANFATGLKKGLKVAGAALTAASAGLVKLSTDVVGAYGEYEQLVGGVQKIFGEMDYEAVVENASNAFETAGLSANDYMETVTSFSASLIQSLDGDTEAAVAYADKAITDMSDNANTFGTDMASIQYAYQGFAKGNFTMLDNLKLGYGGTKTEMERLIEDAEKLDSSFSATRDTNGDLTLSYADIVDAIHIVQDNMNITGTTAEEASETVQGSINAMKGAWENLLTGMGDPDADIGQLTENFTASFETVMSNIEPVLQNMSRVLPSVLETLLDTAADILPDMLVELLPAAITGLTKLAAQLVVHLPEIIMGVVEGLVDGFAEAITGEKTGWFDSMLGEYEDAIAELAAENESLADSIDGTREAFDSQIESASTNAVVAETLWGELQTLMEVEDKSAGQKARIKDLVEKLNELVPGLGLAYDDLSDSINMTDEEMQRHIDLMILEARQQAANEMYVQSIKDGIQAQKDYEKALADYDGTLRELGITEEEYNNALKDGKITKGELISMTDDQAKALFQIDEIADQVAQAQQNVADAEQNVIDAADNQVAAEEMLTATYKALEEAGMDLVTTFGESFEQTFGYDMPTSLENALLSAQEAGIGIPSSLTEGILNGSISVDEAVAQLMEMLNQSEEAAAKGTDTGSAFVEATASVVVDERNQVNSAVAGIKDELDISDESYTEGADAASNYTAGITDNTYLATDSASEMAAGILGEFDDTPASMYASGDDSGANMASGIGAELGTVQAKLSRMNGYFTSEFRDVAMTMKQTGQQGSQMLGSALASGSSSSVLPAMWGMKAGITSAMASLPSQMYSAGSNAGAGLYNGLAGWSGALSGLAWSIANSINAAARAALRIKSPSRVMMEVGEYTAEGLALGLDNGTGSVIDSAESMALSVVDATDGIMAQANAEMVGTTLGTVSADVNTLVGGSADLNANINGTDSVISILGNLYNAVVAISKMQWVTDTGALVGELAEPMNKAFAELQTAAGRG